MFEDLKEQARRAQGDFENRVAGLMNDGHLSPQGKAEAVGKEEKNRRETVAQIQEEAHRRADGEKAKVAKAIETIKREYFEKKRATLGDALLFQLYERRLRLMDSGEMADFFAGTVEGFEREMTRELVKVQLAERSESLTGEDLQLLHEVDDTPAGLKSLELQARQLDHVDDDIARLDVEGYKRDFADRYGFQADALKEVEIL